MKILVTGGSGYIGKHAVAHLMGLGHEVASLDRAPAGPFSKTHFLGDLGDFPFVRQVFSIFHPDVIIHLAGNSNMSYSYQNPGQYVKQVLDAASNLVNAANEFGCGVLLFSSSCSVYGDKIAAIETSSKSPLSPYASSKSLAEDLFEYASKFNNLRVGIFRFFNVVGCRPDLGLTEDHEPESHILPILVKAASTGGHVNIYSSRGALSDPTGLRDYIDVSDIVQGLTLGMNKFFEDKKLKFEVWNLGSAKGLSTLQLLRMVETQVGRKIKFSLQAARQGDPHEVSSSAAKAAIELGWSCTVPITESIRSTIIAETKTKGLN